MTPKFLSLEFHTRFFPALLRASLRPRERGGTGFSSVSEFYVLFVVCLILVVVGLPIAVSNRSFVGYAVGGVGLLGVLVLLLNSIFSCKETPTYDSFLAGVFFFFVVIGLTSGVFVGTLEHSLTQGVLVGAAGLIAGYILGIWAGVWLQYLGWLAPMVNGLAALAVLGMLAVDLVLLSLSFF